jgi:putative ABC transport system permease protein
MNQVSADYFRTLDIPLRAGRFLNDRDLVGAQPVIVIDDSLAHQLLPGENPIGKHLSFGKKSWEIVGVVGGARYWTLTQEPFAQMYFSYHQVNWGSMGLVVRSKAGDPMQLAGPLRTELAAIDRNQPIHSFKALQEITAELVAPQKFTTLLLASFAGLSALLSAIGIYGVISYSVSQSTREIGVRMALGAPTRSVLKLVIGSGMTLSVIGIGLGLVASYGLTRLMTTLLFEVKPTDLLTFAAVSVGLLLVALVACYIPARRATKVSPLEALRLE